MANSEHLAKLKEGVEAWNDWRKANTEIVPDLSDADLSDANLRWAHLKGARLNRATLIGANLTAANLGGADLRAATLAGANLRAANLSGADLTGAMITQTTFAANDLSNVKGLEKVRHYGPSTIGIDTLYRSRGKIPLAFLRGAGVPDNFIEYMGSLTGKA